MTATVPSAPLLALYNQNGVFSGAPSQWASGPATNIAVEYMAWNIDWATYGTAFIAQCNSSGLIPFVELEPWHAPDSSGAWDLTPLFSAIEAGTYDSWLEEIGTSIAATEKPCILTFAHEFNVSGQYPWAQGDTGSGPGGGTLTATQWIAGWTYVRSKVNEYAGGYALWMWAPGGAELSSSVIDPTPWWPGSEYVDMVGLDAYPNPYWGTANGTFAGNVQPVLTLVRALGWSGPVYISETNLAQMVNLGGQDITSFVADMYAAGISGIMEWEDSQYGSDNCVFQMTSAQWATYNAAVATYYGSGSSGSGGGGTTYAQTLIDAFPGSSLNSSLWVTPVDDNGISVSGGSLKIEGLTNYEQVVVETTPYTHNLADGIFALQLSQSGTPVEGTMWFLGIADNYVSSGGNAYEFQSFPGGGSAGGAGSWYSWAFAGTDVSGDTGSQDILSLSVWNNGDWLGIGNYNLNGENDVHVYKSPDGDNWTEIASFTVTGAIDESACGFYFGTNYDSGTTATSTYVATIDNVSWFTRGAVAVAAPQLLMAGIT